ncbi:substrate-binding domain-containing protein [Candidatus Poribacteria bacterium]|nr:substrate-binding domain-containing protein [Candidatus Poribacteria bacterium]
MKLQRKTENNGRAQGVLRLVLFCFIYTTLLIVLTACDKGEERTKIGVILSGANQFDCMVMDEGIEDNAEKYGAKIVRSEEGFPTILESDIAALILSHYHSRERELIIRETHKIGIPVVLLNDPLPPDTHVEGYVKFDNFEAGKAIADFVVKRLNGSGNVIILEGPRNDNVSRQLTLGIYRILEKSEGIRVVADEYHPEWDERLAAQTTRETLNKYADNIQAIIACSSELSMGAVKAVKERRLTDRIITAGIGAKLNACMAIKNGNHDAEVDRMLYERGIEALSIAIAVAKDSDFGYDEELGEQDPKIKVKFGPLRIITKENISLMNKTWPQLDSGR